MKLLCTPTETITHLDGRRVRLWTGELQDDAGQQICDTKARVYIAVIAMPTDAPAEAHGLLQREIEDLPAVMEKADGFSLRQIL